MIALSPSTPISTPLTTPAATAKATARGAANNTPVARAKATVPAEKKTVAPVQARGAAPAARHNAVAVDDDSTTPAAAKPAPQQTVARAGQAGAAHPGSRTVSARPPTTVAPGKNDNTAVTSTAAAPAPKSAANGVATDALGATFCDETNGYSMRFPAGWSMRSFNGDPWVLDCGDGRVALISIGFSPFPAGFTADNIPPEWIARRIRKRRDTVLHGQGYATVAGRKALWSKSTGPLPMTNSTPRMTRVNYILPLADGRVVELRIAAAPDQFDRIFPTMKRAVQTFQLTPAPSRDAVASTH